MPASGLLGGAEEVLNCTSSGAVRRERLRCFPRDQRSVADNATPREGQNSQLSSVLGLIPAPYFALYSSTKHAVEGYSESLDHELRPFGIRVALVEPAYTRTSFEDNLARPDQLLDIYNSARAGMNVVVRKAIEKGDTPEVVAQTVLDGCD